MAFIGTQLCFQHMISMKHFILARAAMRSISLLCYQEDSKILSLRYWDDKPLEVYSMDLMVDKAQLGFWVSARDRQIVVYLHLPEAKESSGGMYLLRRCLHLEIAGHHELAKISMMPGIVLDKLTET
ncbi:hypothetical protein CB1_002748003 [Camelus ferus]|nr:hypothetical protein CB1_002748003 [Camelus ferus]